VDRATTMYWVLCEREKLLFETQAFLRILSCGLHFCVCCQGRRAETIPSDMAKTIPIWESIQIYCILPAAIITVDPVKNVNQHVSTGDKSKKLFSKLSTPNYTSAKRYELFSMELWIYGVVFPCFLLTTNFKTFPISSIYLHLCPENAILSGIVSLLTREENLLFKKIETLVLIVMMDYDVVEADSDAVFVSVVTAAAWIDKCIDHSMACCNLVMPQNHILFPTKIRGSKAHQVV